jgi:hypothetical protein
VGHFHKKNIQISAKSNRHRKAAHRRLPTATVQFPPNVILDALVQVHDEQDFEVAEAILLSEEANDVLS